MFEKEIQNLRKALSEENQILVEAIDELKKEVQQLNETIKKANMEWNG